MVTRRILSVCAAALIGMLALVKMASGQTGAEADRLNIEALRLYQVGKSNEALPLAQRALALREATLRMAGARETESVVAQIAVAQSLNTLANVYTSIGRYGEAERLLTRAIGIIEALGGPKHERVGFLSDQLGVLYHMQGRLADAETALVRGLTIRQSTLPAEHPEVAQSLANLGMVYLSQGRAAEAAAHVKQSMAIREKVLPPGHPDLAHSLNSLAGLHVEAGRYAEAEPLFKRAISMLEAAYGREHPNLATSLNNLALRYQEQGLYQEALALLMRSLAIREQHTPVHLDVALSLNNIAALQVAYGDFANAEVFYKRSLDIAEKAVGRDHAQTGNILGNLGEFYRMQGRSAEAEPLLKRGLAIDQKAYGPSHPRVATALNNMALLVHGEGRTAEAELMFKRSLAIREAILGPAHPLVGATLANLAGIALSQRDFDGAVRHWRQSTAIVQSRDARGLTTAITEGQRETRQGWAHFAGLLKATYRLPTGGQDRLARARDMFEIAQWGLGSEASATLAQMAARSAGGAPGLSGLVRERQDLLAEWQAKDKLLIVSKSNPPAERDAANETVLSGRLAAIDARLAAIDATLAQDFPDYAALSSPKPISVADVQASLRDSEALVLFFDTDSRFKPLPEEAFVWVVTKTEMRWVRSPLGTDALTREVAALRCGLDYQGAWTIESSRCKELTGVDYTAYDRYDGKPLPFDPARSHALYESLFSDVRDLIAGKQLLIVPSGPLTQLPFQTLVTRKPAAGALATGPDIEWLARTHAITVLPAVSSLKSLRRNAKASEAVEPFIGYGDPLLTGVPECGSIVVPDSCPDVSAKIPASFSPDASNRALAAPAPITRSGPVSRILSMYYRSGLADVGKVRALCPLPDTAHELACVARTLGAPKRSIVLGAAMTEASIKAAELDRYRVVHFATHGLLAGETATLAKSKAEPALVFSPPDKPTESDDGLLTASEIAGLKLDADWVVMSACNTAGGGTQDGEALSGLARAFFYAGARALLVSHWHVNSVAATLLTSRTFAEIRANPKLGRAEAFRRSMLALMADKTRPWAAHPSSWAPFVVVGEGGAGT